jgi:hypothetical protein
MSNSTSTKGRLKKSGDCSGGHHVGGENHNHLILLIPGFSLRDIFRSSVFPQAHTNVNFN